MKKYIGGRATGKTYQLIQEARKNNGIVIVRNVNHAEYLKHDYPDMKDQILTFDQYMTIIIENVVAGDIRTKESADQYKLYIDDFDEIAANYLPGKVMAGTINVEGNVFMFSKGR